MMTVTVFRVGKAAAASPSQHHFYKEHVDSEHTVR